MFKNSSKRGFTLIEVLISSTLLLLLLWNSYNILGQTLFSWKKGTIIIDFQQNARVAMQLIERDIKNAKPYSDSIYIFIKSDGSEMRFKLFNNKGELDEIRYYKSGNLLLRRINNGGSNNVAYNVRNLNFNFYRNPETEILNRSIVIIDLEVGNDSYFYKISSNTHVRSSW